MEELSRIQEQAKADSLAGYVFLLVLFGFGTFVLGEAALWLGEFVSDILGTTARLVAWGLGCVTAIYALAAFARGNREKRRLINSDIALATVQEVEVWESRVAEVAAIDSRQPVIAFEINKNKLLLLQGQWLIDPATYGLPNDDRDPFDACVNGLGPPNSFPSSRFVVTRLANSGLVLSIRVLGDYVTPQGPLEALETQFEFPDSEILDGELSDLPSALSRAHKKRLLIKGDRP